MQTDFENINMYVVSFSHPAIFLIQSIINVFTKMMFSNFLGDQGKCLSVRPAVAYIDTLLRPSVAEHFAHPIAWIRLKKKRPPFDDRLVRLIEDGRLLRTVAQPSLLGGCFRSLFLGYLF